MVAPTNIPYNCLMGFGGPRRWYVVVVDMHTCIYYTHFEADRLVVGVPTNSHRKFTYPSDSECWLEQQFQINGNAHQVTNHKKQLVWLKTDPFGHDVYSYNYCVKEFRTNSFM